MTPLSTTLSNQGDRLQQLAHLVSTLDERLGNALILQATQIGLASLAAKTLERDLTYARCTLDAIMADVAEEEHATARRQAGATFIAAVLAPTPPAHAPPPPREQPR